MPVNVIVQDNEGYLLLGTADGVFKFDGRNSVGLARDNALLRKEISALFIDSRDKIWIGTKQGKVYSLQKNKIDSLNFTAFPNEEKITSFYELNGSLYIGSYGNGLYVLKNNKLSHFTTEQGLSDNVIYKIAGNNKNTIWCGTDAGISELNVQNPKPSCHIISDKTGLPDNIVRDLVFENDHLLIAMQDSGLCYYNILKKEIQKHPFFSNWTQGAVLNAFSQAQNKIVIGTESNGLIQFDKGSINIYNYQKYIQCAGINQVFIDRENQIWLASKKGISQFSERRFTFINAANGLKDDKVLAIAADNDNGIWIGTTSGISKIMRDEEGKIVVSKINDLNKYTISCATKAPDGNIWFGTYGNGIIILSSETNKSVILNSSEDHLADNNISNIYFADEHTVYISTLGSGIIKARVQLEGREKSFEIERTYTEADGLGSNYIYAAITDTNANLYVATDGGGLEYLVNGSFINLTKKYGILSNTIYSLCRDKLNSIWATSNANGIINYNGKTIISINAAKGLRDEQPQQLIASGDLIYALNAKGIDRINCIDHSISYFDVFDGDLEPNLNAIFLNDNKLCSGTNNGILCYRSGNEHGDSIKPIAFIKSVQVNFKPIALDSAFEFNYNQNNFAISFNGIWLKNPNKLVFRYRLNGLEDNWQTADEGKTINYNNLAAGNYLFMLQVKNEEDVWSNYTQYAFVINTPIWKRWWFWLLVVASFSTGLYLFFSYRLRRLQRENLILESRVKERTFQIEKQSKIIEAKNSELEQLSLVASKTDNVVLILDPQGKLEYINESFVKQNQMNLEEIKARYGETIYEISNNPNIRGIIEEAVNEKRSVHYESLNKKVETGAEIWESSTLTPIFDEQGQLKKIIIIDTDVTERKRQEQIIVQKNKDITDSISYARKIQHAILPSDALIKTHVPHSFVLYMTKDIVSGDFYWFGHFDDFSIIAAVDCTGHGVPGAFMSLIGYNLLNRIINERKISDPKEILLELNNGVLGVLHRNESESKDGMDIAICKINHKQNTLEYAGAMRPLWIVNNHELREIKADKIPIGTKQKDREEKIEYTTQLIQVAKGDSFYIFTDGYADQFGGPKDKKFSTGRLKELIIQASVHDCHTQENMLKQEHLKWKMDNEQVDDILVIGFRVG